MRAERVNLVPMAGAGKRFVDAGYAVPKPLIPIDGLPMVVRAARSLPEADRWIFVCRKEHVASSHIDKVLTEYFPGAVCVSIDRLTEGQMCTCLLAREFLNDDDILTIGACDNAMTYSAETFRDLIGGEATDALIWTFRNNPAVLQDPRMYGWVAVDSGGIVERVSCKIPISESPLNDHAVIGSFTFRRAGDFLASADETIRQNRRIRNEFYIDEQMNVAIEMGLRVKVMEVDRYVCWGTPGDVETYNKSGKWQVAGGK